MTNEQIIFNHSVKLVKEGIIKGTGRFFTMETEEGEKITIEEPEAIHTFAAWKAKGRQVMKGQHAVTKITIWKKGKDKTTTDEETKEETTVSGKMFMKTAFFFTIDQTEPIKK